METPTTLMSAATRGSIVRIEAAHAVEKLNDLKNVCGNYMDPEVSQAINKIIEACKYESTLIPNEFVERYRKGEKGIENITPYDLVRVRLWDFGKEAGKGTPLFWDNEYSYRRYENTIECKENVTVSGARTYDSHFVDGVYNIGYSDGTYFHVLTKVRNYVCTTKDMVMTDSKYWSDNISKDLIDNIISKEEAIEKNRFSKYEDGSKLKRYNHKSYVREEIIEYLESHNIPFWEQITSRMNHFEVPSGFTSEESEILALEREYHDIYYEAGKIELCNIESFKNKISRKATICDNFPGFYNFMDFRV